MIKIKRLTDYALQIMCYLAVNSTKSNPAKTIAETLHLATPTVSKILKILQVTNFITSTRGPEGGYRLALVANQITLYDLVAVMEGTPGLTDCSNHPGLCRIESHCLLKFNWRSLNEVLLNALKEITLLDMLTPLTTHPVILQGIHWSRPAQKRQGH